MSSLKPQSMRNRVTALICSGALVVSALGAPALALADENTPSAVNGGTGATTVTVQLKEKLPVNPETGKPEDVGTPTDNVKFTVPAQINFVISNDGDLTGPSGENAAYFENQSAFAMHVSSLQVSEEGGWNIVADSKNPDEAHKSAENLIDFKVGPDGDELAAASYLTKKSAVTIPAKWNMSAQSAGTNKLAVNTSGHVEKVTTDVVSQSKVATLRWYITPTKAQAE